VVTLVGVISTETFQAVLSQGEKANPIASDQNEVNQGQPQSKTATSKTDGHYVGDGSTPFGA
jgi:hypothetical protein